MNSATTVTLKDLLLTKYLVKNLKIKNNNNAPILTATNFTKIAGRGMEYAESRLYQPGDDVRHIDWRITARQGKTFTKLFHEEKGENNYIILDLSSSLYFGTKYYLKSVVAAKIASFLLWLGFFESNNIGGIVFNNHEISLTKAKLSKNNIISIFNKIVEYHNPKLLTDNQTSKINLSVVLEKYKYLFNKHSRIYVISDFLSIDDLLYHQLQMLSAKNLINLIKVRDVIETTDLLPGRYDVSNGSECLPIVIDRNNHQLLKNFFAQKTDNYKKLIAKLNIKNIEIATLPDWHKQLFSQIK